MLPPQIRLLGVSEYALKYRITSDGTDVDITQAQLVADAATHPVPETYIGKLLKNTKTFAAWAALVEKKNFSIYVTMRTVTAGARMLTTGPQTDLGTRVLRISPCAGLGSPVPAEADIELRYIHSIVN